MSLTYAELGVIVLVALIFPLLILCVSWLVFPKPKPTPGKLVTYECGIDTQGETWVQYKIAYFMYALVFVAFDVETVFLIPWAASFKSMLSQGSFVFVEMFIFIAILVIGFWYAWKEGALEWM